MNLAKSIEEHRKTFVDIIEKPVFTIGSNEVNPEEWFKAVLGVLTRIKSENNGIFLIGNGASSSMASHFAVDFTKNGGIRSFSNNEGALLTCFGNDFSFETSYREMVKCYMKKGDALIAISSSGKSKNIVNAAEYVSKNKDNCLITFSGFSLDNPLRKMGGYNLYINAADYGMVESAHAYYLHMVIDLFISSNKE